MTQFSKLYIGTFVAVVAAYIITIASAPVDTTRCPNLSDGTPQYYDDQDGQCHPCLLCEPGEGLTESCGAGQGKNAQCERCLDGTYQPIYAAQECSNCRLCFNTMRDEIPCTATTDRQCGQCLYGYFHYESRKDHCVSCEDEKSSYLFPDCQLTTPQPTGKKEQPRIETLTTFPPPHEGSLSPAVIAVIVILALAVICALVVIVLVWKNRQTTCPCPGSNTSRLRRLKNEGQRKTTTANVPETENLMDTDPEPTLINSPAQGVELIRIGTPITVHCSQDQHDGAPPASDDNNASGQTNESQPEIKPLEGPNPDPAKTTSRPTSESMQTAVPLDPNQYADLESADNNDGLGDQKEEDSKSEGNPPNVRDSATSDTMLVSDVGEMGSEGDRRDSKGSSTSKGTQTSSESSPPASPEELQDEYEKCKQILKRFDEAIEYTKDVPISKIDSEDIALLNNKMHERPQLLSSSTIFHYGKFAQLFQTEDDDIRRMQSAEDVLNHLVTTRMAEVTVAKVLQKLKDSGKCCHIVRGLVDQILKRKHPYAG